MSDAASNIDTFYAVASGRKTYFQDSLNEYTKASWGDQALAHGATPRTEKNVEKANLLSSELASGNHMPVIDCDYGIQAIPSSTPGHYHLYIDQELSWQQYKALLDGFLTAGLIQKAWYENAIREKRSYVRLPHVKKETPQPTPTP